MSERSGLKIAGLPIIQHMNALLILINPRYEYLFYRENTDEEANELLNIEIAFLKMIGYCFSADYLPDDYVSKTPPPQVVTPPPRVKTPPPQLFI